MTVGPSVAGELRRHARQCTDVGGHILAGDAVAARRAEHQPAVLIAQAAESPSILGSAMTSIASSATAPVRRPAEEIADAGEEIAHILFVEGVFERQHRHAYA